MEKVIGLAVVCAGLVFYRHRDTLSEAPLGDWVALAAVGLLALWLLTPKNRDGGNPSRAERVAGALGKAFQLVRRNRRPLPSTPDKHV
jgi:hypothetical protein